MPTSFRADHIGSFLRPAELLEARRGPAPDQLRQIEDQHILRVLARQKELGFEIATDGELRRRNFMSDFTDAVEVSICPAISDGLGKAGMKRPGPPSAA